RIKKRLSERTGDVKTISQDLEIRNLENLKNARNQDVEKEYLIENIRKLLYRYILNYHDYSELYIVHPASGKVIVSTDKQAEGADRSREDSFTTALETEALYIKDIFYSDRSKTPGMAFSIPVFCVAHEKKHIVGILVTQIDLKRSLYPLLANRTGMGKTGESLIVNQKGVALNELRWHNNAPLALKIDAEPAVRAAGGKTGVLETEDYRGVNVLAAYSHIPSIHWGLVVKQDLMEVFEPVKGMLFYVAMLFVIAALFVFVLSLFLARTISRPIIEITETAQKIRKGDLSARSQVTGVDVPALLALSFNDMARAVQTQEELNHINDDITRTMLEAENVNTFRADFLKKLVTLTDSQMGAYFILNRETDRFEIFTSIGIDHELVSDFDIPSLEGDLGLALESRTITCIKDIPDDTVFSFKTFTGNIKPREIILSPIILNKHATGVICLASITPYPDKIFDIMALPWTKQLETALTIMLANEKKAVMAEELQAQANELQEQSEELKQQNFELDIQKNQVEAANRMKTEFLSNMSHELRTPLNSVMALSRVLLMYSADKLSEEETGYLEIIERNGKNLLTLINDILDMSKIEAGKLELTPAPFSMAATIETIIERLDPIAREKDIKLEVTLPTDLPLIESDETRVTQIIQNIVNNGIKFTEQGHVHVRAKHDDTHIYLDISDTGIGIASEDLTRIFEEFIQVDGSSARHHEGSGLGLAIAYKCAKILGGALTVQSTPGKGSTFSLTLPVKWTETFPASEALDLKPFSDNIAAPDNQHEPDNQENRVREKKTRNKARILLVEDNDAAVIQVKTILENNGYTVDVANGGRQALEYVKTTIPDGIVLDLMMPEVDGFEVLENIRSTPATREIPVLILTARDLTRNDLNRLSANKIQQLIFKGEVDPDGLLFKIGLMLQAKLSSGPETLNKLPENSPKETLPDPSSSEIEGPPDTSLREHPVKAETILVVEDHPDNMKTIKAILQNRYTLHEAFDGKTGIEMVWTVQPDLVLLDMLLPEMDGFAVVRQIKQDNRTAHIPVIAMTAQAMKGDRENILQAGCDDYMSKPVNPQEVIEKINQWLKREN
ncbi:MAG: response regulator, partial [Desulfobacteraceae bacterium]